MSWDKDKEFDQNKFWNVLRQQEARKDRLRRRIRVLLVLVLGIGIGFTGVSLVWHDQFQKLEVTTRSQLATLQAQHESQVATLEAQIHIYDPQAPFPADLVMTLERTWCYWECPMYVVTIHGDGNVTYEGIDYVAVKGKQSTTISKEQVQQLLEAFDQAQFFFLDDEYVTPTMDIPTIYTSIQINGRTKRVKRYTSGGNGELSDEQRLVTLEESIDRIVNTDQWVKKP